MPKLKYVAQNLICGLGPMRRGADGRMIHHELKIGEVIELELDVAEPMVVSGSLVPQNKVAYQEIGGQPHNPNPLSEYRARAVDGKVKVTPFA